MKKLKWTEETDVIPPENNNIMVSRLGFLEPLRDTRIGQTKNVVVGSSQYFTEDMFLKSIRNSSIGKMSGHPAVI
jgi:hypothetical protein